MMTAAALGRGPPGEGAMLNAAKIRAGARRRPGGGPVSTRKRVLWWAAAGAAAALAGWIALAVAMAILEVKSMPKYPPDPPD